MDSRPVTAVKQVRCPRCKAPLPMVVGLEEAKVVCSACGGKFLVQRQNPVQQEPDAVEKQVAPEDDAYELESPPPVASPTSEYEVEAPVEHPPVLVEMYNSSRTREIRAAELPPPPKWTFFSGVFTFPWYRATLGVWIAMSLGLAMAGAFAAFIAVRVGLIGQGGDMFGAVAAGFVSLAAIWTVVLTLSFIWACCEVVIQETSDGFDEILEWPFADWRQWVFAVAQPLLIMGISMLPGYGLGLLLRVPVWIPLLASAYLLWPILMLSALECCSVLAPWSPPVLKTLGSAPRIWLAFYGVSGMALALWLVPLVVISRYDPLIAAVVTAPLMAAGCLIYARLLGRLAWRISLIGPEKPDQGEATEPEIDAAGKIELPPTMRFDWLEDETTEESDPSAEHFAGPSSP